MKKSKRQDGGRDRRIRFSAFSFFNYVLIFLAVCFVTSVGIMGFLAKADADIPAEVIRVRAQVTFVNVFILALILTLIIGISRKIRIERPLKNILRATDRISAGDFSARIEARKGLHFQNELDVITENINSMAAELSSVETLRTDFISNVSHELKSPLAVMQNYAVMLQAPDLTEDQRKEYAKAVSSNCRRLTALITNILKMNKLENQQIYAEVQPYDLGEQLRECVLAFESLWTEKQIELDVDIDDGILSHTDGELLSLVWNNLLSNALKFTPPHGMVRISLRRAGEKALVCVSDTGCGMSEETMKHIFEKFYQGDTSHATQGNGLGLALALRVLQLSGGMIDVESTPGKGTRFIVTMPE